MQPNGRIFCQSYTSIHYFFDTSSSKTATFAARILTTTIILEATTLFVNAVPPGTEGLATTRVEKHPYGANIAR